MIDDTPLKTPIAWIRQDLLGQAGKVYVEIAIDHGNYNIETVKIGGEYQDLVERFRGGFTDFGPRPNKEGHHVELVNGQYRLKT